jgi:hypothetical protein
MGFESEPFELPYNGGTVQLRGLTGFEVVLGRKRYPDDEVSLNAFMIGLAMGADLKVCEGVGLAFMKEHMAGDYDATARRIQELSGMTEDAAKSRVRTDGERSDD